LKWLEERRASQGRESRFLASGRGEMAASSREAWKAALPRPKNHEVDEA
jgi:hypothetical protein